MEFCHYQQALERLVREMLNEDVSQRLRTYATIKSLCGELLVLAENIRWEEGTLDLEERVAEGLTWCRRLAGLEPAGGENEERMAYLAWREFNVLDAEACPSPMAAMGMRVL